MLCSCDFSDFVLLPTAIPYQRNSFLFQQKLEKIKDYRINNAELEFGISSDTTNLNIYAVNYNVLRIMSGMGGLLYSN